MMNLPSHRTLLPPIAHD